MAIDEILEERVVSSRGKTKPRGVKRKMSDYNLRKRGESRAQPAPQQVAVIQIK